MAYAPFLIFGLILIGVGLLFRWFPGLGTDTWKLMMSWTYKDRFDGRQWGRDQGSFLIGCGAVFILLTALVAISRLL